jgi:hypothetical protein
MSTIRYMLKTILLVFITITFSETILAQPPACTQSISGGAGSRVVNNNQVLCLNGPGSFNGSILVNSGGHLVVCGGNFTITGSLTIQPGGKYWRTPTARVIGSLAIFGAQSNSASNCGTHPEINLRGGGLNIGDGDTSPRTADDTDFGSIPTASGSITNTYTIQNTGTAALSITGAITSSDAQFTITQPSSTSIAAGGSQTFDVTFDPSASGVFTSTIVIPNDDSNENPYNFNVVGEGTGPLPDMSLKGLSGISIARNDLTPNAEDGTSFGTQTANTGTKTQIYEISNSGPGVLSIGTIDVKSRGGNGNAYDAHYTVTQPTSTTVAPGSSVNFSVAFAPTAAVWAGRNDNAGNKAAYLRIPSNDPNGNYDFDIHGTGVGGNPFDCISGAMVIANANPSDWYSVDYNDLTLPLTTLNTTLTVMLDGVDINPNDGFVYGMRRDQSVARNQLWVVADDGVRQFKGNVAGISTAGSHTSGAFAADGYLYAKRDGNNTILQKIDVHGLTSTAITLSSSCSFKDMAYHPSNGLFYAVSTAGTIGLVSIDPTTGTVTLIGNNGAQDQNAVYASSDGNIYAQATTGVMYKWDISDGSQEIASADPSYNLQSNLYDGASCGLITLPGIPEIVIRGNGIEIIDGATTHALETGQSFGAHQRNSGSQTNTFWIVNEGQGNLNISGAIDIRSGSSGQSNAYDNHFTVVQPSSTIISAGDSIGFTVTYAPTANGTHGRSTGGSGRAWFRVTSNDIDEAVYDVAIRGVGTIGGQFDCAQDPVIISVQGGGTDFHSVDISADPNTRTALNTTATAHFDGISLNPSNNMVYAVRYTSNNRNQLWLMDAGGDFVFAGYLTGDGVAHNSNTHYAAGSFSSDGYLYVQKNGNSTTNFYKIDVEALTSTQIVLSQSIQVRDLVFNPDDNLLYGYSFNGLDGLVSIDPTDGTVNLIGGNGDISHAAMFRTISGDIYLMSVSHDMYSVDISTGTLTQVGTAPSWAGGGWMDATSCGCLNPSGPPVPISSITAGSFSSPSTWDCNCVPQPTNNVVISNDITINNDFDQLAGRSFSVGNGNTVAVQNGYKLSIAGDLTNNGTISGDLSLNGTSLQTPILGITENLEINNSAGVTLSADLDITGYLKLTDGVLNTDGYDVTLKSTASKTALTIDVAGSINGDVIVERFVPSAPSGHHFLSSPVSSASINELVDDINVSLSGPTPTLYYYDETVQSDHSIDGWEAPISLSHLMSPGTGLTAYFDATNGVTVDIEGAANAGNICVSLNSTPPIIPYVGNCPPDGWNLVGNPYPSPIDYDALMGLSSTSSDVENALYLWDPNTRTYLSYINGVSSPASFGGIIPSMQAFWVRTSASANLCFENTIRISDPNAATNDFYKSATMNDPLLRLTINGQGLADEAVFRFAEDATNGYDNKFDARVLRDIQDADIELASQTSQGLLKINSLPELVADPVVIPLMTEIKTAGNYQISIAQFDNFGTKDKVYLVDHVLNIVHELNIPYSFSSLANGSASRFSVRVVPDASTSFEQVEHKSMRVFKCQADVLCFDMKTMNNNDQVVKIFNTLGQNIHTVKLEAGQQMYQLSLPNLKEQSIYMVELSNASKVFKIAW